METRKAAIALTLVFALAASVAGAQQVYRCEGRDGSVTFSDLPCGSDTGSEEKVDASPHQGHRAPEAGPAAAAVDPPERASTTAGGGRTSERTRNAGRAHSAAQELSRKERLSLERSRKSTLSALKRRHIDGERRRELIDELRRVDEKLGIGPGDVADMPFHDRSVYEDHRVYPGV
ncbi:DUF4124 domain-containing protein [Wenzhouxiangella sp. EGI_FJ10409]|uniref:DUF4124 domain-containing protein n=1 Tax=Wenzhouxiangella sp. EGI_FJ10409 TaxID=3243767 RepID=UPI0035E10AD6